MQTGISLRFGGETGVVRRTWMARRSHPATWTRHLGFSYSKRENDALRLRRERDDRRRALRPQLEAWTANRRDGRCSGHRHRDLRRVTVGRRHRRHSDRWALRHPRHAGFVHQSAIRDVGRGRSRSALRERHRGRIILDAPAISAALGAPRPRPVLARDAFRPAKSASACRTISSSISVAPTPCAAGSLGSRRGRDQFIGTLEYTYVAQPVRPFSVKGFNFYAGVQVVAFADLGLTSERRRTTRRRTWRSTATASDCDCWCRSSTSSASTSPGASRDKARPSISACRSRPLASVSACADDEPRGRRQPYVVSARCAHTRLCRLPNKSSDSSRRIAARSLRR